MIFCLKFSVPKFAVLGWSKQLMPVTVKFRLDFIWRFVVASCNVCPCFHVTKATKQWRIVKIAFLATVGSKCGSQAFRCPCSENVAHCQKEICSTCLFKESIPAILCCKDIQLMESQSSSIVRVDVWAVNQYGSDWISDDFEWSFAINFLYPNLLSLLDPSNSCPSQWSFDFVVCDLQGHLLWHLARVGPMFPCSKSHEAMNSCRDWAFVHSGLEMGLPAFQLPMFTKCHVLPKGDLFDMFV